MLRCHLLLWGHCCGRCHILLLLLLLLCHLLLWGHCGDLLRRCHLLLRCHGGVVLPGHWQELLRLLLRLRGGHCCCIWLNRNGGCGRV